MLSHTIINSNDIFHIHTFRCKHAENISDEQYIKTAIKLNAHSICFTDHAPFPENPFGNRMNYEELEEYLTTLSNLKHKYKDIIQVQIGLEIEYFPYFDQIGYYRQLKKDNRINCLLLGQHMASDPTNPNIYTFSWTKEQLINKEYLILGQTIVNAINTKYFDIIAHPDRIFRRCNQWTPQINTIAKEIIHLSNILNIPLEYNLASIDEPNQHRPEFWNLIPDTSKIIVGLDAHSINEMINKYQQQQKSLSKNIDIV